MWPGSTCDVCDRDWPADAGWCGGCGARLDPAPRAARSWQLPGWLVPAAVVVALVAVTVTSVPTPERVPEARTDVRVPEERVTEAFTPAMSAPRCDRDGLTSACVLWTSEAAPADVTPIATNGRIIGASGRDLVAVRTGDGHLDWRVADLGTVIFLYARSPSDRYALALTEDRTVHVVDAVEGVVTLSLDGVLPVFPGVVDDRIAVLDDDATVVYDVVDGGAVTVADTVDTMPDGRLLDGGGFAWWEGATVHVDPLDDGPAMAVDLGDGVVVDVTANADLLLATMADGGLVGVSRTDGEVRWTSPDGVADPRLVRVTSQGILAAWQPGDRGAFTVRVLSLEGTVLRQLGVDQLAGLEADGDEFLVLSREPEGLAITVLAQRSEVTIGSDGVPVRVGDRRIEVPGGDGPWYFDDGRGVLSGTDGASIVDLVGNQPVVTIGEGATAAVSARTPTIHTSDGLLHRVVTEQLS